MILMPINMTLAATNMKQVVILLKSKISIYLVITELVIIHQRLKIITHKIIIKEQLITMTTVTSIKHLKNMQVETIINYRTTYK